MWYSCRTEFVCLAARLTSMLGSLYSDRPLAVSPALAATIGLEQAVMVHVLAELITFRPTEQLPAHPGLDFVLLGAADTGRFFPFWKSADIDRIRLRLMQLDMIAYEPHPEREGAAWYALQRIDSAPKQSSRVRRRRGTTGPIPPDWQPDAEWVKQCRHLNIPEGFVHAQVSRFVAYWRERGLARHSWGNEFVDWALKHWRKEQTAAAARERFSDMGWNWRPDDVAVEILVRDGVNRNFIEDAVPEFVLYWMERGTERDTWNPIFINHVQRQWQRLRTVGLHGREPRPISDDWRPDSACLEILQLAQIDERWALEQVPEFLLYWRETGEARESWNSIFLQRMKQLWARRLSDRTGGSIDAGGQVAQGPGDREDREWVEFHTDRWWTEAGST